MLYSVIAMQDRFSMMSFVHVILDEVSLVVIIVGFWCNDSSEVAYDHAGLGSMLRWCNGSERAKFASRAGRGGTCVLQPAGSATAAHDEGCHQRLDKEAVNERAGGFGVKVSRAPNKRH